MHLCDYHIWSSGSLRELTCEVQLRIWRVTSRKGLLLGNIKVNGKQFSAEIDTRPRTSCGSIFVRIEDDSLSLCLCVSEVGGGYTVFYALLRYLVALKEFYLLIIFS